MLQHPQGVTPSSFRFYVLWMVHSQGGDTRNLKCSQTDRGVHPGVGLEDRQKGEVSFPPAPTQTDFGHGHRHVFASPNVKLREQIPGKGGTPSAPPAEPLLPLKGTLQHPLVS